VHPNPAFRHDDRALFETLIEEIGFGMVFATTPDGPRVAHTPLLSTGDGAVQFHLARGNGLTRHLDGMTALAVINGPDAYVSPRWYADQTRVPTWNYVTLELEGRVRRMDQDGLLAMLEALSNRQEGRIALGTFWTMDNAQGHRRLRA
jgi:transcriptional regulator